MYRFIIVPLFALSLFYFQFEGNTMTKQSSSEPITLRYADSLVGTKTDAKGITREFAGNVSFQQGIVVVNCDRAFQYITSNAAELIGNVVVTQQDLILKSPRIFYNGETGIAESYKTITIEDKNVKLRADKGLYSTVSYVADFFGNIKITDDTVTITSDTAKYNRRTRFSFATGNAKVEDDSTIIYADTLNYDRETRNSVAVGNVIVKGKYSEVYLFADSIRNLTRERYTIARSHPVLFKIDTVKSDSAVYNEQTISIDTIKVQSYDTLSISSNIMEAIRDYGDEQYVFTGNVEVNKIDLQAKSEKAVYRKDKEKIFLTGKPVVWFDSTQIIADTIVISAKNNKLETVHAIGSALATIRNDTAHPDYINQLSGKEIYMRFSQDTIRRLDCYGDSKALMFMVSEKNNDGAARTYADSIYVDFVDGEADTFGALGGIVGEAVPSDIIDQNPKLYYLPNFKRDDAKPQKKVLIFNKK